MRASQAANEASRPPPNSPSAKKAFVKLSWTTSSTCSRRRKKRAAMSATLRRWRRNSSSKAASSPPRASAASSASARSGSRVGAWPEMSAVSSILRAYKYHTGGAEKKAAALTLQRPPPSGLRVSETDELLELCLPLPRAAAGAELLAALLALLAGGLKLRLLLAGEHVVHLVHHARLRHLALDLRVGARLRGGADGRLVERPAGERVEPVALLRAVPALRLEGRAVALLDLAQLLLLRVGQVQLGEAAEAAAAPTPAAAPWPTPRA